MRQLSFTFFLLILTILGCKNPQEPIMVEKEIIGAVFRDAVDSIYFKLDSAKVFTKSKSKTIVLDDSMTIFEAPGRTEIYRYFKNENVILDFRFDSFEYKLDSEIYNGDLKFDYKTLTEARKPNDSIDFKEYAMPGVLRFTRARLDKDFSVAVLAGIFSPKNIWKTKTFYIYTRHVNGKWELERVALMNRAAKSGLP